MQALTWYICRTMHAREDGPYTDGVSVEPIVLSEASRCPACGRFISMLPWLPPYNAELECWTDEYSDVAPVAGRSWLVTERFKQMYDGAGLIGLLGFEPCRILRARRMRGRRSPLGPIPTYYRTIAARSDAHVDDAASCIVREHETPWCPECHGASGPRTFEQIVLRGDPYPREDICEVRGLDGYLVASQRFVDACEGAGVRGLKFIECCKYRKAARFGLGM